MSDMYTDVERSCYQRLMDVQAQLSLDYKVYNNLVTKKDYPSVHAAISIMKVSDVPNFANGGGTQASVQTPVLDSNGDIVEFTNQEWPQFWDLLYQFVTVADDIIDARKCDMLIRQAFRPRKGLLLLNTDAVPPVWTDRRLDFQYAGYINRDVPEDFKYWRVTNIRFETPNWEDIDPMAIPAITHITTTINVANTANSNVDVVISEL